MSRKNISSLATVIWLSLVLGLLSSARAQGGYDPTNQTPALLYDEARTVYLGNLARRDNGIPPLRRNLQLTHAGRWFAWDSVENRPGGYCGHQDTLGRWPSDRAPVFGYLGGAGAENAFCGYVTPQQAIDGWMNSPGHRANLLDPNSREVGLGYYRRDSDGHGYVVQAFGNDAVYAPIIIENEAVATTSTNVNLYIYDRLSDAGFAGLGTTTQMMVSNNPNFCGATWEPYNANKAWMLAGGSGWRNVYVKTRDATNRTLTVSDTIYLGAEANVPWSELGAAQMSTTQPQVTLYNLNGGAMPQVQFSPGWLADDTLQSFVKWWGNGERVNDVAAWGGTAYRLRPGNGESYAWVDDWKFPITDIPMVAYFRLKVNDNTSSAEVARISVTGGGTEYGPLSLKGTDFAAPNQYQEFALNFTFNTPDPDFNFLTFNFWRSGSADLYVDAVSIFSTPQAITSPLTWPVPGNNYRGQGVWVRYTNGSQFSEISEAATTQQSSCIVIVSGNTGAAGTTLSYEDGTVKTVTANGSGNYSITVPYGWSGTITPYKAGYTFSPTSRNYGNLQSNQTSQNYTATACGSCADVKVLIGGTQMGGYTLGASQSWRQSYPLDDGPVKVASTNGVPIIAALRDAFLVGGQVESFSQLMGLPKEQLSDTYYFPAYNNLTLSGQLRFANVDTFATEVTVTIGGVDQGTYPLQPNQSQRVSYPLDTGPVVIKSSNGAKIIAALRDAFFVNGQVESFVQLMGLPEEQLSDTYYFPAYNNLTLSGQLRFANVDNIATEVTVTIGGVDQGTYPLQPNQSQRVSYPLDTGPVVITSSNGAKIIAALRDAYLVGGQVESFSQLMGLPQEQLSDSYVFPAYNNLTLSGQLRFANVDNIDTDVTITIGGQAQPIITLQAGQSQRVSYPLDSGPVVVESSNGAKIIVALRDAYLVNNRVVSFVQMMGLPQAALSDTSYFPAYNNLTLSGQLRFGVP
jgi:hypothetical protein